MDNNNKKMKNRTKFKKLCVNFEGKKHWSFIMDSIIWRAIVKKRNW